ncbi:MAG: murein hydrolase activator EnvC family protein [Saprospiraceae bacterium]
MKFPYATCVYNKYAVVIFALALLAIIPATGQSRRDLEEKRKSLLREINRTGEELISAQKNKKATLQVIVTMQQQIQSRQQLVRNTEAEIVQLDNAIRSNQNTLKALEDKTRELRNEYARMLRLAFRYKLTNSPLVFLLSADNINDAFSRWQYLRQYDRHRTRYARLIMETENNLQNKMVSLRQNRLQKQEMQSSLSQQQKQLDSELRKKDALLKSLKTNEQKLLAELIRQEEERRQLDQAIESVIRRELAVPKTRARPDDPLPVAGPETVPATAAFGFNKGQLPWPVSGGRIVRAFGTQQHPRFKDVKTQNNGIDIRAEGSNVVRAVADGRVSSIQVVPGYQNTLIIQHGEYYSVYSNLAEVMVARKDQVLEGQEIGKLDNTVMELHFELWREKSRLNPEPWIKK